MEKLQSNSEKVSQLFWYDAVQDNWSPVSTLNPIPVQINAPPISGTEISVYNEVDSVPFNITTKLITYTVPADNNFFLNKIDVNGDNIAGYTFKVNSAVWDRKFSSFFEYSLTFNFENFTKGFSFAENDLLEIWVVHNRPFNGSFNARIQGILLA